MLRRVATLLLLLAVPLRVYAATAMLFCGPVDVAAEPTVAVMQMDAGQPMDHGHHGDASDPVLDHQSCASCCCTGMIATARFAWRPPSFAAPTTPEFAAGTVPPPIPHRLERPPRDVVA